MNNISWAQISQYIEPVVPGWCGYSRRSLSWKLPRLLNRTGPEQNSDLKKKRVFPVFQDSSSKQTPIGRIG